MGISPALLCWCKEYRERGESSFPGNGVRSREGEAGRVAELVKRLKEAETESDILKKILRHHLHERSLIYQFIKDHSQKWKIEMMCRVLGVSRSSYYRWIKNPINKREQKQMELSREIKDVYFDAKGRNGSPRLAKDLQASGVIGWSISDNLTASGTVIQAIRMANRNRPLKEGMIFHSERGLQYACKQTVNLLQYYRVEQSMSGATVGITLF